MVDCMKLNLQLRTANKVFWKLDSFKAEKPDDIYQNLLQLQWDELIPVESYFTVSSYAEHDSVTDTRYPNLLVKDAIADYFLRKFEQRPNSGSEKDQIAFFLHWVNNEAIIYLDTSGETLSKHGYRIMPHSAPMVEALAAGVILSSKWNKESSFINPMCGSGTLAIEAALLASERAPGLLRNNYSFMHVKTFDKKAWGELRAEAKALVKPTLDFDIIASDLDPKGLNAARTNAQKAGVEHLIKFERCDFSRTTIPENRGVIMLNPEYGERLGEEKDLEEVYKRIGDFFKQECKGYTGYIFTGNSHLAKRIGLKASRRMEFFNARIDCRLLEYDLYEGSRRVQKEGDE